MKEVQQRRIENELQFIMENKTSEIQIQTKKINKEEYRVDITIPSALSLSEIDIALLLYIPMTYPFAPPRLFFKTNFAFPHISDGRDVISSIIETQWSSNHKLIDIIEKIPKFIIEYNNALKEGYLLQAGAFYLGETYDMALIESLPLYTQKVKEIQVINGNTHEVIKLLAISDIYFSLYEIDRKSKGSAVLTFWSHLRALITIKRIVSKGKYHFYWRNKIKSKKFFQLSLFITNGTEIVNLILGKIKCFGIKYNITQRTLEERTGQPMPEDTDIEMIENQIVEIEQKVNQEPSLELVQFLMTLYEKAVDYYSALNDPKYEMYTKKIQNTLSTPVMKDFMEKDSSIKENITAKEVNRENNELKEEKPNENKGSQVLKVEMSKELNDDLINISGDEEDEEDT